MLKNQPSFFHEGICHTYTDANVITFGIPFDGTVSNRPGTRFGPQAIRNELDGLETFSPYLNKDMVDYTFCDLGDLSLPFGNTKKVITTIENEVSAILNDNKRIVALGGEHLVSYPIIKAYAERYNDLHIIHFDAHADLREDYLGECLSHATVMRRVCDVVPPTNVWQYGIRSGTRDEFTFGEQQTHLHRFSVSQVQEAVSAIGEHPVYVTIDLDVLDPSIFSGTGTPEPGGITFNQLMDALKLLLPLNVVGADIVELAPHYDTSGVSTAVACKVLREMALIIAS